MNKEEFIERYGEEKYRKCLERVKKYFFISKESRAKMLLKGYKREDRMRRNAETTITAEQIAEMFDNGCYWCGEKDWTKLGIDRLDNSKPHTLENCVCSCYKCNNKRSIESHKRPILQYTLDGKFVAEYESIREAVLKTGIKSIPNYLLKQKYRKSAGGYLWKYKDAA